jgi:ATP-dependent RNA helicase RhlE
MSFQSLALHEALMSAIEAAGYTEATEVQQQAIPLGLQGADLMVSSRTGSGKTAAFLLPILAQGSGAP